MNNCTCRNDKPENCPVHMRFWVGKDEDEDQEEREISAWELVE